MEKALTRHDIRRVVVLLAGSRTGSSYLFRQLRFNGRFISPNGEETPFYRLAGVGIFSGYDYSDAISEAPSEATLDRVAQNLLQDVGIRLPQSANEVEKKLFAEDCLKRIELQWPRAIPISAQNEVKALLCAELDRLPEDFGDWTQFYLDWVTRLRDLGFPVQPSLLNASSPDIPSGDLALIEEPPFIAAEPRIAVTKSAGQELPLLLKTSTNVYRVPFLKSLFPKAEFSWILLQRNPAATISALMDGWLSGGFHSHDLQKHLKLDIRGYSDRIPGGERYWKFDLPPGWQDHIRSPLQEVCAHQWMSAHRALDVIESELPARCLRVRYEDLTSTSRPTSQMTHALEKILSFVGAPPMVSSSSSPSWKNEAVAAVSPPQTGKWKKRMDVIQSLLREYRDGGLLDLAQKLGYDVTSIDSWP